MSQLLVRIAKISSSSIVKKHGLCFSELRSLSTAATPYLLFDETVQDEMTLSCEPLVELNLYDPRKEETVKIPDQTLTKELLRSRKVGSSRGWMVGKYDLSPMRWSYESTFHLTNMYNPCASASSRKVISLPPTKEKITDISLSASPEQEDCVVAALSSGKSLIMCRPGDSDWTPIKMPFYWASGMIYSKRDGKFYLNRVSKEEYDGPVDLIDTSSGFPQVSLYKGFPLSNIPQSRLEQLSSVDKYQHIVESPCGQSFTVYWLEESLTKEEFKALHPKEPPHQYFFKKKLKGFVVFRQDPEQRIASYTEDIGDLCIFLGDNEAFCVSATEYPGLKPNSVYFAKYDRGFGFYDLSSNTVHDVIDRPPFSCCNYWLAPLE
ncbi:hypothetical protein AALP_AAs47945U000300 [Arabis alpina]|uniref:KIB1-4 beta-propeller domain-containing protein n=1 Tax=Arabis alpina TaxID=50452 RepID=A0A087FXX3_ARAAL|nr:hypothetical protein AALP_AAs47945U000300 [Arabis alpina]